jgi:hypothetical protein
MKLEENNIKDEHDEEEQQTYEYCSAGPKQQTEENSKLRRTTDYCICSIVVKRKAC